MTGSIEWFKTRDLGHGVWAIDDHGSDTIYLVAGSERALLVDTGWGIGDLPGLVASLTRLPLVVVNSHGHPDHTYGNGQFPTVHISEADAALVVQPPTLDRRRMISERILPQPLPAWFSFDKWAVSGPASLVTIGEGHVFDLGDRTLEAILIPGHSRGSIALLDRKHRLLLVGDSLLTSNIWLHLESSAPLAEFQRSLRKLQGRAGEFDQMLPAHVTSPLPRSFLDEVAAGVDAILDGRAVGTPESTFAGDGLCCRFGAFGILYRPERLH